jgi:hypothetical protein
MTGPTTVESDRQIARWLAVGGFRQFAENAAANPRFLQRQ